MLMKWLRERRAFAASVVDEAERICCEHGRLYAYRVASQIAREQGQDPKRQRFTFAVRNAVADRLGIRRGYDNATRRLYGD